MGSTIKDVARETGLAISTISKYLNGGSVRPDNAAAIESAIQKLNYAPNVAARGLRSAKTFRIGIVTGNVHNPHTAAIVSLFERHFRQLGYSMILACYESNEEMTLKQVEYMIRRGVDGLIFSTNDSGVNFAKVLDGTNIPIVALEESLTGLTTDLVQADCVNGSYLLVETLIKQGHRKIAILKGNANGQSAQERYLGYQRAMHDYRIEIASAYVINGTYSYESGFRGMEQLIRLPDPPTAVFASNYNLCVGAAAAINQYGIRVPEELSLVSFDDFMFSTLFQPHITAAAQPLHQIVATASHLLEQRMQGDYTDFPELIRIKTEMHERDSVVNRKGSHPFSE